MAAFFPFLRLPRELRDEIYKYFVTPPLCLAPYTLRRNHTPPYSTISLDLCIMRVNKQIHEEASRIFYSQTVFPIRIIISDWHARSTDTTQFEVSYEAPWEELLYSYAENGYGSYRGFEDFDPKCSRPIADDDLDAYTTPSPRYREFIRHIRIYILDSRLSLQGWRKQAISKAARDRVRKILVPLAYRLEKVLAGAGKKVEVEIKVISTILEEENRDAQNSSSAVTDDTKATETLNLYEELIETTWPFTTGPWTYELKLPAYIEQQYPGLGAKVLRWCDEHNELTEEEKSKYQVFKTRYPYLWALKNGRLIVMEEPGPDFL